MRENNEAPQPRIVSGRITTSSTVPASSARTPVVSGRAPVVSASSARTPVVSGRAPAASERMTTRPNTTISEKSTSTSQSSRIAVPRADAPNQSGRIRVSSRSSSRADAVDDMKDGGNRKSARSKASFFKTYAKEIKIGGAVAAAVLLCVIVFAMTRSGKAKVTRGLKATPDAKEQYTDRTPSSVWAGRGKEKLAKGDRQGAMADYVNAASAAEREGNSNLAMQYSLQAEDIVKTTKLTDMH